MNNINLTQTQKEYIKLIIDKFSVNEDKQTIITIKEAHEQLKSTNIISTRSKLSSPKMKKIFIYHNQQDVGKDKEPYLELKSDYTIQELKDYVNTNDNDNNN